MARFICPDDCGNSPRKVFLKDFYQALADNDLSQIEPILNEKSSLQLAGQNEFKGKENILNHLLSENLQDIIEWRIDSMITHGRDASVSGVCMFKNKTLPFSDVFRFKSAAGMELFSVKRHLVAQ